MPISVHYGLRVLIWGLTWTAIRLGASLALLGNYVLFGSAKA